MKIKVKLLSLVFLLSSITLTAQNNLGLWSSIGFSKKITSDLSFTASGQTRIAGSIDFLQSYFGDFGLEYKINKKFDIGGYYRWVNRRKDIDDDFDSRHRFYFDLKYGDGFGKVNFSNRVRYQHLFEDNEGEIEFLSNYIRNRIDLGYEINKQLEPYVSADFFYNIQGSEIDQVRPRIGAKYKINKKNSVDFGLLSNFDLSGDNEAYAILYLNYRIKI
jgi:hypothetical protein